MSGKERRLLKSRTGYRLRSTNYGKSASTRRPRLVAEDTISAVEKIWFVERPKLVAETRVFAVQKMNFVERPKLAVERPKLAVKIGNFVIKRPKLAVEPSKLAIAKMKPARGTMKPARGTMKLNVEVTIVKERPKITFEVMNLIVVVMKFVADVVMATDIFLSEIGVRGMTLRAVGVGDGHASSGVRREVFEGGE